MTSIGGETASVLVTGASGFIGQSAVARLAAEGFDVRASSRRSLAGMPSRARFVTAPDLGLGADWRALLRGCDAVVHTAARVHVMRESATDPLTEFRRVNVEGTLRLARQAAEMGVRRFVFLSSIKVNGDHTLPGKAYTPDAASAPRDPYGISKAEAETGLRAIADEGRMEVTTIRPVMVYGPGVKGNFYSMMRWLNARTPLPFGRVENKRSVVALENLVDLIVQCLRSTAAANETFLVSDGKDLSTTELLRRVALALDRRALLVPVPASLLHIGAKVVGKQDLAQRLLGSLQVDISKTRQLLGWTPPVSTDEQLRSTARWFTEHNDSIGSGNRV